MKASILIVAIISLVGARGQDSLTKALQFSAYLEVYYGYDVNKPQNHTRPNFIYNYNRSQEMNINLAYGKVNYTSDRVRANFALGTGTYMNANYATEPGVLKNIYEANAGYRLLRNTILWLDAGVFASHIGFESAVGKDCNALTRCMMSDNTPFYETGLRLGFNSKNGKWYLAGFLLNGWQHIQRPDGNSTPAFGTQLSYSPNGRLSFNYSTFIGNEKPDSARQMRYYNNLYAILQWSEHFSLIAGFDLGMEQTAKGSADLNWLYSPALILKYEWQSANSLAARLEYYRDKNGIIVKSGTPNGFNCYGWSVNFDRKLSDHFVWRIEMRQLLGKDDYFLKRDNSTTSQYLFFTSSLAIAF